MNSQLQKTHVLHTDKLQNKYGYIESHILRHENHGKRIREVQIKDSSGITRTHAMSFRIYNTKNREVQEIDRKLGEYGSKLLLGPTFRGAGFRNKRIIMAGGVCTIPKKIYESFGINSDQAKWCLVKFITVKNNKAITYGYILEIYCPDFKDPWGIIENFPQATKAILDICTKFEEEIDGLVLKR